MIVVLLTHTDDTEASGRITRPPAGLAGASVLRSALRRVLRSALPVAGPGLVADEVEQCLVTSSAWVQIIACGLPAMRVERALFSSAGSLRLVAS
jgi:hypothetical protein